MSEDHSHYTSRNNPYLEVPSLQGHTGKVNLGDLVAPVDHLELEIGFGRGQFIRGRAGVIGQGVILGFETKRKLVYLCQQKGANAGLTNMVVMHGDARVVVERLVESACFDNIFVHFPDPWWKARHAKRMVVTDALTDQVVRLLKPGGHFFVQTDVQFRAQEYHRILVANPQLQPDGDNGWVDENPFEARSSRERRAMELGMPVYRLLFVRR